jgi:hypothetical protein
MKVTKTTNLRLRVLVTFVIKCNIEVGGFSF